MKDNYSKIALSVTNMILRMFLQGLIPIYPFIIGKMTPGSNAVGIFLSLSYAFLFLGTYLTGMVVPKYINPKTMLLCSALPIVCSLAAYGIITNLWLFDFCGCFLSFFLGLHICSNNILMGYYSSEESVSKNFSILSTSSLLATVLGGFTVGPLLLWLGYKVAFIIFALVLLVFFSSLLPLKQPIIQLKIEAKKHFVISKNLWLLLIFNFLISLLLYGFKLTISVLLKKHGWNVSNISILMAIGTATALPVTIWWGKISNYKNAKLLLCICILLGFIAYGTLFGSGIYVLGLIGFACISVVAYSIVIPLMSILFKWYDHHSLPRSQSLSSSAVWISAIVGFLYNGYALQHFTQTVCILGGLVIALLSIVPLLFIKTKKSI